MLRHTKHISSGMHVSSRSASVSCASHANLLVRLPQRALLVLLALVGLAMCSGMASVQAAQASVIWSANPTKPILEDWANEAAEPGRITEVPFASVPGGHAYRVEIREGDNPGGYGERDELGMGNPERAGVPVFHEGDEAWIAFQFRMQSPYPISEEHYYWNIIMQLHQRGGVGVPPFAINVEDNKFMVLRSPGNEVHGSQAAGAWPAEVDKWSKFLIHVKFSPDPAVGSIEMFGELNEDKSGIVSLLKNTKTRTMMEQNGVVVPTHARIGSYRGNWSPRPAAVTYYAGFTIASDRASAEGSAFGSTGSAESSGSQEPPTSGSQESPKSQEPPASQPPTTEPPTTERPVAETLGSESPAPEGPMTKSPEGQSSSESGSTGGFWFLGLRLLNRITAWLGRFSADWTSASGRTAIRSSSAPPRIVGVAQAAQGARFGGGGRARACDVDRGWRRFLVQVNSRTGDH